MTRTTTVIGAPTLKPNVEKEKREKEKQNDGKLSMVFIERNQRPNCLKKSYSKGQSNVTLHGITSTAY